MPDSPDRLDEARELYSAYLDRVRAGEVADIDGFCERHPEHAEFLRALHAGTEYGEDESSSFIVRSLLRRLAAESAGEAGTAERTETGIAGRQTSPVAHGERYEVRREIARGGMGVVLEVRDHELSRTIAMKVLLGPATQGSERGKGSSSTPAFVRFLEESQVTAQLYHPGIVPVYERGLDPEGRPYFTMPFVKGRELGEIFRLARKGEEGWNLSRAVGILVKVCQALAYAHARGVIHRDLKPTNVMVGEFGEVYVMDWGLAKVTGRTDERDLRPRTESKEETSAVVSERESVAAQSPESPIITADGAIIGTPAYMPPEQATGRVEEIDQLSDVYALGAMLYVLLAGQPPYVDRGARLSPRMILARVMEMPPRRIHNLDRTAPPELVAICEKAMAREKTSRYASSLTLAEDLQAWIDGRVVKAYRTGAAAEFGSWVRRNRATALSLVIIVVLALGGLLSMIIVQRSANVTITKKKHEADAARADAEKARMESERTLVDMYEFTGLLADERGEPDQAALWFARSALQAPPDAPSRNANRIRLRIWSKAFPVPVRAFLNDRRSPVQSLEFHRSGAFLLVQGRGWVRVRDLAREQTLELPRFHVATWNSAGDRLATAPAGSTVEVLAFPSGEKLHSIETPGPVTCIAFSRDDALLAIAGQRLRLWDCAAAEYVAGEFEHPGPVQHLAFDPGAGRLLTWSADGVRLFDVERRPDRPFAGGPSLGPVEHREKHAKPIFVDRGRGLVTIEGPKELSWWDTSAGARVRTIAAPHTTSLLESPDGRYLAVSHSSVRLWDVAAGRWIGAPMAFGSSVYSVAFTADSKALVAGSVDGYARLWSVPAGEPLSGPIRHQADAGPVAFSPDGEHFAVAQPGGLVRLWRRPQPYRWHGKPIPVGARSEAALSADGQYVMAVGWRIFPRQLTRTRVHEVSSGKPAGAEMDVGGYIAHGVFSPRRHERAVLLSVNRAHHTAEFEASKPLEVQFWDWRRGQQALPPLTTRAAPMRAAFDRDGKQLAVLLDDGRLLGIDPETGKVRTAFPTPTSAPASGAQRYRGYILFSPDGASVVAHFHGNAPTVWDTASGKRRYSMPAEEHTHSTAISADGSYVATGTTKGEVRVRRLKSGEQISPLLAHTDWVNVVRFSGDAQARYLLTGSGDEEVRVWDWRAGRVLFRPMEHESEVYDAVFYAGDGVVLTTSSDSSVVLWDVISGRRLSPRWSAGGIARDIHLTADRDRAVLVGTMHRMLVVDVAALTGAESLAQELDLEGYALLTELSTGQSVQASGGAMNLTAAEWTDRWQKLRSGHADRWPLVEAQRSLETARAGFLGR